MGLLQTVPVPESEAHGASSRHNARAEYLRGGATVFVVLLVLAAAPMGAFFYGPAPAIVWAVLTTAGHVVGAVGA